MKKRVYDKHAIISDCVKLNDDINCKSICAITNKTENSVFKWLNGTLEPDDFSFYCLYEALRRANKRVPRELYRYVNSKANNARKWALANMVDRKGPEYVGEKITLKGAERKFIYKGESVNLSQIAKKLDMHLSTVSKQLKDVKNGVDVSKIVYKRNRGRPRLRKA